jgi:hypothetical protein
MARTVYGRRYSYGNSVSVPRIAVKIVQFMGEIDGAGCFPAGR